MFHYSDLAQSDNYFPITSLTHPSQSTILQEITYSFHHVCSILRLVNLNVDKIKWIINGKLHACKFNMQFSRFPMSATQIWQSRIAVENVLISYFSTAGLKKLGTQLGADICLACKQCKKGPKIGQHEGKYTKIQTKVSNSLICLSLILS